jgi:hypothetical protein
MGKSKKPAMTPESKYERMKKTLLNSLPFAILAILVSGVIYLGGVSKAISEIINLFKPKPPEIILTVTVDDENIACVSCFHSENDNCSPLVQKKVLDVLINNNSDRNVLLTSVKLHPIWVISSFFAGDTTVVGKYNVSLKEWYDKRVEAFDPKVFKSLYNAGRIQKDEHDGLRWIRPDPIEVKDILKDKFIVEKHKPERFKIELGLSRPIDYLYGTVFLQIQTDNEITLRSKDLEISVCEKLE